jgi:NAD(P)-dependent dehydrogenase (short-subunit alcohol dehydrogenase family)
MAFDDRTSDESVERRKAPLVDLTRRLAGDVAVVTGGSQGIGRVVAERLAGEGAAVAVLARTEANVREVADAIAERGGQAVGLPCDVTDRAQVRSALAAVVERFGTLTILVNHAGLFRDAPFLDIPDEMWLQLLGVNLTGMFIVAQEAAREMVRLGVRGRIVNMSSAAAHIAHSGQTVYAVTKAGIEALTRGMAFDLAPYGIIVNAVAPGTIETSFSVGNLSAEAVAERERRIPLGRLGDPAEVASVIAMLASPDASYVTGVVVPIDGGLITAGIRAAAKDTNASQATGRATRSREAMR